MRLAELARAIRDRITTALAIETEIGPLTKLMKAFQEALVHDLDADGFADMYAQTIAYGLLSARIADPKKKTTDDFAAHMRTNPFLRELMETFLKVGGRRGRAGGPGIDFDELGVSEVVELLDQVNMEAVVRDFDDRNPQEDPVIHFYELFLKEYDAKKRMQRGVFYTPRPVVSYIVRSVDGLLRTEFGLDDGLADTSTWGEVAKRYKDLKIPDGVPPTQAFVQILDPATGTGTFLTETIDIIHKTLVAKWNAQGHGEKKIEGLWNEYVPKHLLPRLHGYELMMAPYTITHLKIGLKLHETGYRFASDERARIYLTNALEPEHDVSGTFEFALPALAHEAHAVNVIKRKQRFTVVIGNPPYSNFGQLNRIPFILELLEEYKRELNERKLNLDDDYIKFIRFGHHLLDKARAGIFGMITNNVFFDGVTHRQMRKALRSSFQIISVFDLHGSVKKLEEAPDGSKDENVFDIQQGVGITLLIKKPPYPDTRVHFSEVWGDRDTKFAKLMSIVADLSPASAITCGDPYFFFVPKNFVGIDHYRDWASLPDMMPLHATGVKTHLDDVFVGFSKTEVEAAIAEFLDTHWRKVALSTTKRASPLRKALLLKEALRAEGNFGVIRYAYRAFDDRKVAYLRDAIEAGDHRYPVMRHLLQRNKAIVTTRELSRGGFSHVLVTRSVADMCLLSTATKECAYVFPLELSPDDKLLKGTISDRTNLSSSARSALRQWKGDSDQFFQYIYAILHSPRYRVLYGELLKIEFPRIPLLAHHELFSDVARLGGELVSLHLMESPKLDHVITTYTGPKKAEVERVGWSDDTVWLDAAATKKGHPATAGTIGFRGVPEAVWSFRVGGYQVCEKWLKDRKGRTLSKDDIAHYQKIVVALAETIRLMKEIDEAIEAHGGWPAAFQLEPPRELGGKPSEGSQNVVHLRSAVAHKDKKPVGMLEAAEPPSPQYEAESRRGLEDKEH